MYKTTHRKEGKFSMNNAATEKYTVVVHFIHPLTEKQRVRVYDFNFWMEAIEFFDDVRMMDKNGEAVYKIVGIWLTEADGSIIWDKDSPM